MAVPVPAPIALQLLQFLQDNEVDGELGTVVGEAITAWLGRHGPAAGTAAPPIERGYQWKMLFLPDGSRLRLLFQGDYFYAEVVGDKLMYRGMVLSPAALVNLVEGGVRNAWREVWLRRPGDHRWHLANDVRQQIKFRKQANTAAEAPGPVWPPAASGDCDAQLRVARAVAYTATRRASWLANRNGYLDCCAFDD